MSPQLLAFLWHSVDAAERVAAMRRPSRSRVLALALGVVGLGWSAYHLANSHTRSLA